MNADILVHGMDTQDIARQKIQLERVLFLAMNKKLHLLIAIAATLARSFHLVLLDDITPLEHINLWFRCFIQIANDTSGFNAFTQDDVIFASIVQKIVSIMESEKRHYPNYTQKLACKTLHRISCLCQHANRHVLAFGPLLHKIVKCAEQPMFAIANWVVHGTIEACAYRLGDIFKDSPDDVNLRSVALWLVQEVERNYVSAMKSCVLVREFKTLHDILDEHDFVFRIFPFDPSSYVTLYHHHALKFLRTHLQLEHSRFDKLVRKGEVSVIDSLLYALQEPTECKHDIARFFAWMMTHAKWRSALINDNVFSVFASDWCDHTEAGLATSVLIEFAQVEEYHARIVDSSFFSIAMSAFRMARFTYTLNTECIAGLLRLLPVKLFASTINTRHFARALTFDKDCVNTVALIANLASDRDHRQVIIDKALSRLGELTTARSAQVQWEVARAFAVVADSPDAGVLITLDIHEWVLAVLADDDAPVATRIHALKVISVIDGAGAHDKLSQVDMQNSCDVELTLPTQDGNGTCTIWAHAAVIHARCQKLLGGVHMPSGENPPTQSAWAHFVRYLYTDSVELEGMDPVDAQHLARLADIFDCTYLRNICMHTPVPALSTWTLDFQRVLDDQAHADVVLRTEHLGHGAKQRRTMGCAHRFILEARCPYYAAQFRTETAWAKAGEKATSKELTFDASPRARDIFLRHLYFSDMWDTLKTLDADHTMALEVLVMSHMLRADMLQTLAEFVLAEAVKRENVLVLCQEIDATHAPVLRKACISLCAEEENRRDIDAALESSAMKIHLWDQEIKRDCLLRVVNSR